MLFALFALVSTEPALAKDKPLKCDWRGEAVDPFTGKDNRYMRFFSLTFKRAVNGGVPMETTITEDGMTSNSIDKPLLILLVDGSVVEVPLLPTTAPVHSASSYGVSTAHALTGTIPLETMKKFVEVPITHIRWPIPNKEWTRAMDKGDAKDFTTLARCLLEP